MKYEDDLMYAGEAIQKIASEAMQRVENLYKLRFSLPRDPVSRDPASQDPVSRDPLEPSTYTPARKISTVEVPEKIDTTFDLVDNFTHNLKPTTAKPANSAKPNLQSAMGPLGSIDERPEKIDSNLHGLTL